MAKQTFTAAQILTAAQMTSLQQTAMGGGSATAKTTSYVLVAADAGGTVIMNAAGSTTITVNTSLFAAGDTVLIVNTGAGTCTVTAGTATVSTAGSLALTQYESGILYFTATGTAIFNDYVQAGSNPLTTTGDMIYSSSGSTQARLGIGSTGNVLTVASGIPSWAAPAGGSKVLQVVSTTYSTRVDIATTTYTDSGLSLSITPTLNTSKILCLSSQYLYIDSTGVVYREAAVRLMRDSTAIYNNISTGDTLGGNIAGTSTGALYFANAISYLDSPATTSAITYKTQGKVSTTSGSSNISFQKNSQASMVLLEIGA